MIDNRRPTRLALMACLSTLLLAAGLWGCKSAPEEAGAESEATQQAVAERRAPARFEAFEHLNQRARWFPADTELVAVADAAYLWAFFGELVPADEGVSARERAAGLRERLSEVFRDRIRLDLTQANSAVMAASENRVALIFDGQFEPPQGATQLEMNGYEVFRLDQPFEGAFAGEFLQLMAGQLDLWMVMLEEPRGVAIFVDEMAVERATARMAQGAESLADSERLASFEALFELTDRGRLVVAGAGAQADEMPTTAPGSEMGASGVESADEAILAFGPSVQASFRGSAESLDQIEDEVQRNLARLQSQFRELDRVVPGETLLEASAGAIVAFLGESYIDALDVSRQGDVLSYALPLPENRSSAVVAAVLGLGLTDWLEQGVQFGRALAPTSEHSTQ
ncbi:hypothetical protein FIV42_23460 [Persicimonas caeni]|uniref:DUF3352 domain-containing protein n=1 Tax=Persicimonas caeni TaxID=2292766 RepID=A0A4Y6PZ59_PERCE|nr:hypothetical protein [Persicimonas caeni]QDG53592.1 hypothetical protein FIV42_23460 [Persicimonas caeni]QED34813.1 hypothetical protein FRD00_23455 [Persicimonas caeni]